MTTSGSSDFTLNRNAICQEALEMNQVVSFGQNAKQEDINKAANTLNMMFKTWRARYRMLWKQDWITVTFTQSNFVIGSDNNCYECIRNHASASDNKPITGTQYPSYWRLKYNDWVSGTSYVPGDIVVGSDNLLYECQVQNVASASDEPITGGSWATYWALYSSITPTTWSVAQSYTSIGNVAITSDIVGVGDAFIREGVSDSILYTHLTTEEYFGYGDKVSESKPTDIYFRRRAISSTQGSNSLFFYPYPASSTQYVVNIEVYRMPEDFDAAANTSDAFQEWIEATTYNLGAKLHHKYHILTPVEYSQLRKDAEQSLAAAIGLDNEKGNIMFSPKLN